MISAPVSDSPEVIDEVACPATTPRLRLTSEADTVFSSIQQTAAALVTAASAQAINRAAPVKGAPSETQAAAEERLSLVIQRANADQARRAADCARAAFEALVCHCLQPCFALDQTATIIRWNAAMANWTGIEAAEACGATLSALFDEKSADAIAEAGWALREAEALPGGVDADPTYVIDGGFRLRNGVSAFRVSLLPLCRLPRIVEAIFVLVSPAPAD